MTIWLPVSRTEAMSQFPSSARRSMSRLVLAGQIQARLVYDPDAYNVGAAPLKLP
jgi:hypothetical protein